jgi:hypothetical protein
MLHDLTLCKCAVDNLLQAHTAAATAIVLLQLLLCLVCKLYVLQQLRHVIIVAKADVHCYACNLYCIL